MLLNNIVKVQFVSDEVFNFVLQKVLYEILGLFFRVPFSHIIPLKLLGMYTPSTCNCLNLKVLNLIIHKICCYKANPMRSW